MKICKAVISHEAEATSERGKTVFVEQKVPTWLKREQLLEATICTLCLSLLLLTD